MPGKRAIDIVLLPPENISQKAIYMNRRLVGVRSQSILLNSMVAFPHISLVMGVVTESLLSALIDAVEEIVQDSPPFTLRLNHTKSSPPATDSEHPITVWKADRAPELQYFHTSLMDKTADLLTHDATLDMFVSPPPVTETVLKWVNRYHTKFSYHRFDPHITLGQGILPSRDQPETQTFAAQNIAICHLGTYCTCRKILWSGIIGEMDT